MRSSCSKEQVHQAVAAWAGVGIDQVSAQTPLNGLGGKSWPEDAPALISVLEQLCGCVIPDVDYEIWAHVDDIDDYLGAD
ncbi:hypothetical protein KAX06_06515 [candidate division WOR-3 bacterium]|jgi:acyl carrier protein|nr:hypothetical protein [candidate division WOR-3 bacterium]MCK4334419.1 hypothetical protein [candidate division WOR-3 bacterium]